MTNNLSTEKRIDIDIIVGANYPHSKNINPIDSNIEKSLKLIDSRIKKHKYGSNSQNCFSYALGVQEEVSGEAIDLIAKKINFRKKGHPGDIIWYFKSGIVNHAGKFVSSDVVRSKWGIFSVFDHPIFSLPNVYGDVVRYSSVPDKKLVKQYSLTLLGSYSEDPFFLDGCYY